MQLDLKVLEHVFAELDTGGGVKFESGTPIQILSPFPHPPPQGSYRSVFHFYTSFQRSLLRGLEIFTCGTMVGVRE